MHRLSDFNENTCLDLTNDKANDLPVINTLICYLQNYLDLDLVYCKNLHIKSSTKELDPYQDRLYINDPNVKVLIVEYVDVRSLYIDYADLKCIAFINCVNVDSSPYNTLKEIIVIDCDDYDNTEHKLCIDKKEDINNSRYVHYNEDKNEYSFVPENEV
jgi:hypothetical protein